jgi:hypothetical protein
MPRRHCPRQQRARLADPGSAYRRANKKFRRAGRRAAGIFHLYTMLYEDLVAAARKVGHDRGSTGWRRPADYAHGGRRCARLTDSTGQLSAFSFSTSTRTGPTPRSGAPSRPSRRPIPRAISSRGRPAEDPVGHRAPAREPADLHHCCSAHAVHEHGDHGVVHPAGLSRSPICWRTCRCAPRTCC